MVDALPGEEGGSFPVVTLEIWLATTCFGLNRGIALLAPGIIITARIRKLQLWEPIILHKRLLLIAELQLQGHCPLQHPELLHEVHNVRLLLQTLPPLLKQSLLLRLLQLLHARTKPCRCEALFEAAQLPRIQPVSLLLLKVKVLLVRFRLLVLSLCFFFSASSVLLSFRPVQLGHDVVFQCVVVKEGDHCSENDGEGFF